MIKTVLFDLGNVLARVDRRLICQRLAAVSPYDSVKVEQRVFGNTIELESETGLIDETGHRDAVAKAIDAGTSLSMRRFRHAFWSGIDVMPERFGLIEQAKRCGNRSFLLSNISDVHRKWFLEKTDLSDRLDGIFFSYEVGAMKPERAIFEYVIRFLQVKAETMLLIDDREENCVAATKIGMHTLLTNSTDITIASRLKRELSFGGQRNVAIR